MSALADFVYGLAKAAFGWGQEQAEKPKQIVHEDQDEKLAKEWREYLTAHGVAAVDGFPPDPGPFGYGPVPDRLRDSKDSSPGRQP